MRILHGICCLVCLFLISAVAWADSTRSGYVILHVDLSRYKDEPVRLWVPYPISDQYQLVSEKIFLMPKYSAKNTTPFSCLR